MRKVATNDPERDLGVARGPGGPPYSRPHLAIPFEHSLYIRRRLKPTLQKTQARREILGRYRFLLAARHILQAEFPGGYFVLAHDQAVSRG